MSRSSSCRSAPLALPAVLVLLGVVAACASPAPGGGDHHPKRTRVEDAPALSGLSASLAAVATNARSSVVRITNLTHTFKRFDRWVQGIAESFTGLFKINPYYDYPYRVLSVPLYLLFGEFEIGDSMGSGFVVKSTPAETLVVTNAHVIENAARLECELVDGRRSEGEVVSVDEDRDLALLRLVDLSGPLPPALRLRQSPGRPGEPVLAVGFPGRDVLEDDVTGVPLADERSDKPNPTVTLGIVSAVDVELGNGLVRYLETDAALNHGNSGCPVLDQAGNALGVAVMIGVDRENEGYAIPVEAMLEAFPDELSGVASSNSQEVAPVGSTSSSG